jgi:two-component system, NarL family, nitrate/nitrite response regulator NarL
MADGKIRILLADDHWVVLDGIKAKLADHPEFEICGVATDGLKAVELAGSLAPNIVVMDISMPKMNGLKAAEEIKRTCGGIRIVIFSMHSAPEYVLSLVKTGVSGYVLKDGPTTELLSALQTVRSGGRYFCARVEEILSAHKV